VIKCPVVNIRQTGRNTKGVTLMRVDDDERVVSVARVVEQDDEDDDAEGLDPDLLVTDEALPDGDESEGDFEE
jgi:DNA gyrase subunit A